MARAVSSQTIPEAGSGRRKIDVGRRLAYRSAFTRTTPNLSDMAEPALAFRTPEDAAHAAAEPAFPLRFVTAASLFDGHDAAINVMRRLLQGSGGEVVHLGHNRAVEEVVTAAIHEDVHAVAVSSYQGGHIEYFRYMLDMLRERGAGHVRIFGGGGGVIVPEEVRALHDYGIARIYTPEDGQRMGLEGMMDDVFERARGALDASALRVPWDDLRAGDFGALARAITCIERGLVNPAELAAGRRPGRAAPVLGITGTGGSGKSSVTDEIVRRARLAFGERLRIAIVAADPTRRRTGGALLGDRIRMNAIDHPGIYMRSLATRASGQEIPARLPEVLAAVQLAGFDLVIVETSGIGQGDAALAPFVDASLYVMTPEFGAASQLEKIDMLDFADVVAINKFDRKGAADALRDVRKQLARNCGIAGAAPERLPVYGTIASRFNDDGVTALFEGVLAALRQNGFADAVDGWGENRLPAPETRVSTRAAAIVPPPRVRYLAEVAETVRGWRARVEAQSVLARERQQLRESARMLEAGTGSGRGADSADGGARAALESLAAEREAALEPEARTLLGGWPALRKAYSERRARVGGRRADDPHRAHPHDPLGEPDPQDLPPALPRRGRPPLLAHARERAGEVPVHRRGVPVQARGRGPASHVRGRGRRGPHERALPLPLAALRGEAALDRVRFRHSLRIRPRSPAGHLRQGREFGGLDRDPRRHEGALRRVRPLRPGDFRLDDHQRSRSDHPRDVPQHRHRPAGGRLRGGARAPARRGGGGGRSAPPPSSGCGGRCRRTSSRRTRGRTPASSRPSSA